MAFKFSRELKTGIVGIGGILLFILGYSYLKSSPLFDNSMTLYAVYDHVGGLQSGTTVSINGFQVGQVKDIRFLDASGKLLVTMSVEVDWPLATNPLLNYSTQESLGVKAFRYCRK